MICCSHGYSKFWFVIRGNALLKEGNKSDKVDGCKLADLLRSGMLRPVYHGENGLRTLGELGRGYQNISKDLTG